MFDSLQAEDEPWLMHCYQPPTDFPLMVSWRSTLIFGEAGSGKSALCMALEQTWRPPGQKPSVLLVHWPVNLTSHRDLTGTALVEQHLKQVLNAVARELLVYLARYPLEWAAAPEWAHQALTWFVRRYLLGDLAYYVASLDREAPDASTRLQHFLAASPPEILDPDAPVSQVYAELIGALERIGLEGVRIMVADLQPWLFADQQRLVETLKSFLSALALFEHSRFTYTIVLPAELQARLLAAGGVSRRRVDSYLLAWEQPELRAIVERRLALALGETDFSLEQLGPAKRLQAWLEGCGGQSPRGWLHSAKYFLPAYLRQPEIRGKRNPLTEAQSLAVQARHPPPLVWDPATGRLMIGWRDVKLQRGSQILFDYLYEHRGEVCSRETLYRVYLAGLNATVPDRLLPAEYASTLDNAIHRLRKDIEPDPGQPVFVVTVKGKGIRLKHA